MKMPYTAGVVNDKQSDLRFCFVDVEKGMEANTRLSAMDNLNI